MPRTILTKLALDLVSRFTSSKQIEVAWILRTELAKLVSMSRFALVKQIDMACMLENLTEQLYLNKRWKLT